MDLDCSSLDLAAAATPCRRVVRAFARLRTEPMACVISSSGLPIIDPWGCLLHRTCRPCSGAWSSCATRSWRQWRPADGSRPAAKQAAALANSDQRSADCSGGAAAAPSHGHFRSFAGSTVPLRGLPMWQSRTRKRLAVPRLVRSRHVCCAFAGGMHLRLASRKRHGAHQLLFFVC